MRVESLEFSLGYLLNQVPDLSPGLRVHSSRRLIQENNLGITNETDGHGEATVSSIRVRVRVRSNLGFRV